MPANNALNNEEDPRDTNTPDASCNASTDTDNEANNDADASKGIDNEGDDKGADDDSVCSDDDARDDSLPSAAPAETSARTSAPRRLSGGGGCGRTIARECVLRRAPVPRSRRVPGRRGRA